MVAKPDYLKKDISWYKFNDNLLGYSLNTGKWETPFPESPLLARAGAQVVMRGHTLILYRWRTEAWASFAWYCKGRFTLIILCALMAK